MEDRGVGKVNADVEFWGRGVVHVRSGFSFAETYHFC